MITKQQFTSRETQLQLINTMIGGSILVFPLMFLESGLIVSTIVLMITGYISFQTCKLYLSHTKEDESDLQYSVKRILGPKWFKFFIGISVFYIFICSISYYMIICEMLYKITEFLATQFSLGKLVPRDELTFRQFGMAYINIIVVTISALLLSIRKTSILAKLNEYGVYCIFLYLIFIVYAFVSNLVNGNLSFHYEKIKFFHYDFGDLASAASWGFSIHISFITILRQNMDQRQNKKNLKATYFYGFFIYLAIGILGGMGIIGRTEYAVPPRTIVDFFSDLNVFSLFVEILYFFNILASFPMIFNILRTRAASYLNGMDELSGRLTLFINTFYLGLAFTLRCFPRLNFVDIITINGAVSCFFLIYFFPVFINFKCFNSISEKPLQKYSMELQYPEKIQENSQNKINLLEQISVETQDDLLSTKDLGVVCNHGLKYNSKFYKRVELPLIFLVGFLIFVYGIYHCIKTLIQ